MMPVLIESREVERIGLVRRRERLTSATGGLLVAGGIVVGRRQRKRGSY